MRFHNYKHGSKNEVITNKIVNTNHPCDQSEQPVIKIKKQFGHHHISIQLIKTFLK